MPDITTRLTVKVIPGAARSEVTGLRDGVLHVKVAAAPEKGKANRELVAFLASAAGVRKSDVLLLRGETSRTKTIGVRGLAEAELLARLTA